MAFKELFPAEEETLFHDHLGKWFVRTMDGSGVLAADRTNTIILITGSGMPLLSNLVYFDNEITAVLEAWNYYHFHKEYYPSDQRDRWQQLYMKQPGLPNPTVSGCDDEDDENDRRIYSEVMEF